LNLQAYYSAQRKRVLRERLASFLSTLALGLALTTSGLVLAVCSSCQSIPEGGLDAAKGGDPERFASLKLEAAGLYEMQPRTRDRVAQALAKHAEAAKISTSDYDQLWQAARVCSWLVEDRVWDKQRDDYGPIRDEALAHVRLGLKFCNQALIVKPDGTEAIFYLATLSGRMGDLDTSFGLDAVSVIETRCKQLIDSGRGGFLQGAPHRVYGSLLFEAPGPPASVGSLRNARKQFELALKAGPDWPENHLYVAMGDIEWGRDKGNNELVEAAKQRLRDKLLAPGVSAPAGYEYEFALWQAKARKLLAR
jgi:hypothetical protein